MTVRKSGSFNSDSSSDSSVSWVVGIPLATVDMGNVRSCNSNALFLLSPKTQKDTKRYQSLTQAQVESEKRGRC